MFLFLSFCPNKFARSPLLKVFEYSIKKSSTESLILFLNRIMKTSLENNDIDLAQNCAKIMDRLQRILKLQYKNIAALSGETHSALANYVPNENTPFCNENTSCGTSLSKYQIIRERETTWL